MKIQRQSFFSFLVHLASYFIRPREKKTISRCVRVTDVEIGGGPETRKVSIKENIIIYVLYEYAVYI